MRKIQAYGAAALLAVSAIAGGVTYAQDATAEAPSAQVAPQQVARTWLGVAVSNEDAGVTIARIAAGSPAETAQLQVGDVLLAVNGTGITSADDLRAIIDAAASGDVVALTVERASAQVSVDVTLSAQIGRGGRGMFAADPLEIAQRSLGAQLEAVDGGYQVVSVDDNSAFDLQVGDVIAAVNGADITTLDWRSLMNPTAETNTITLTVQRSGAEATVTGDLPMFGGRRGGNFPGNRQPGDNNVQPNGNPPNANGGQPGNPPTDGQPGSNPPADGTTV